jgi:hypothetical protein
MKTFPFSRPAAALALASFTLSAPDLRACACCSDPGSYSLRTDKMNEYEFSQLEGVEFAKAELFVTDASDEDPKGITGVADTCTVQAKLERKQWVLTFRTEEGKTGTLKLSVPTKLTDFAADIHDGQKSAGGGPLLYKEWRVEGTVTGTGFFHTAKASYHLVFQGRGNNCDNGSDFTHWRLAVKGKNIDYCYYGALVPEPGTEVPAEPEPAAEGEAKPAAPLKPPTPPEAADKPTPELTPDSTAKPAPVPNKDGE